MKEFTLTALVILAGASLGLVASDFVATKISEQGFEQCKHRGNLRVVNSHFLPQFFYCEKL